MSTKAKRKNRAADEEDRRRKGLVGFPTSANPGARPYVSSRGYNWYVNGRLFGLAKRGQHVSALLQAGNWQAAIGSLEVSRLDHWWDVARAANDLLVYFLRAGLEGATATLRPRPLARTNPANTQERMEELARVLGRWKRALRDRGIPPPFVFWAAEPFPRGEPHVHLVAMVPAGSVSSALSALRRAYYPSRPGPRGRAKPRYATSRLVTASDPLTAASLRQAANGRLLTWLYYTMKARIDDPAQRIARGLPAVLDVEGWGHANGLTATISRVPRSLQALQKRNSTLRTHRQQKLPGSRPGRGSSGGQTTSGVSTKKPGTPVASPRATPAPSPAGMSPSQPLSTPAPTTSSASQPTPQAAPAPAPTTSAVASSLAPGPALLHLAVNDAWVLGKVFGIMPFGVRCEAARALSIRAAVQKSLHGGQNFLMRNMLPPRATPLGLTDRDPMRARLRAIGFREPELAAVMAALQRGMWPRS